MQILIYGELSDPGLTNHLTDLAHRALEAYTNYVKKASLYWKSKTLLGEATQYGCCVHLQFFNHETAETTYWSADLSESTRRSAELAAKLAARCCGGPKRSTRRNGSSGG